MSINVIPDRYKPTQIRRLHHFSGGRFNESNLIDPVSTFENSIRAELNGVSKAKPRKQTTSLYAEEVDVGFLDYVAKMTALRTTMYLMYPCGSDAARNQPQGSLYDGTPKIATRFCGDK